VGLVFEAWRRLVVTRIALSVLPWRTASKLLAASGRRRSYSSTDRLTWAIQSASRFVPRATCLAKAIALQALLARRGRVAILHLGVKTTRTAGFEAHAWLELDGQIILGEGAQQGFATLLSHRADR
jgi:Transglutaminase-like superfamily